MTLPDMPEAILRRIWQEQAFTKDRLATAEGKPVRILSPGTTNTDGGPDFLNAKISIGNILYHGDVELHVDANEWLLHRHDADPHYNKVILHVVLTTTHLSPPARTASRRAIPLLVLHPFLDERFHRAWEKALLDESTDAAHALACAPVNDDVPLSAVNTWLERLARERIELKMRRFEERLKQLADEARHVVREPYPRYYGDPAEIPVPKKEYSKKDFTDKVLWEQLVYEGVMEALGYSKNSLPFLQLARSLPLKVLRTQSLDDTQSIMALLFGTAGLLPASTSVREPESRAYVVQLQTRWKALRSLVKGETLNAGDWLFFRLRPSNFPTARLAAACFLLPALFGNESLRSLIRIFKMELGTKERLRRLHGMFAFEPDDFWKRHYHFLSRPARTPKQKVEAEEEGKSHAVALGVARINDILINTIIPIVLLYARHFNDGVLRSHARQLLSAIPPTQRNAVTDIVQHQLLKTKGVLSSSVHHQGALQLYRFYCSHVRCAECAIGRQLALPRIS